MSDVEWIIQRLDKVRKTGKDTWTAICPGHDDKSPSLSIKDTQEKILIHCHAGCDPVVIMGNIGLEIADLFHTVRPRPRPDDPSIDELILMIAKADRDAGRRLSDAEKDIEAQAFMRQLKRNGGI